MSVRRLLVAALLATSPALPLAAQPTPITIPDPITLNDRVDVTHADLLRGPKKILIPTVLVRFANRGSLSVVNQGRFFQTGGGTARAKGKFVVAGLEKSFVQGLARQLQDDLVARLRAVGHTVLTYDDVKDNPEVVKMGRYKPDEDYGLPTGGQRGTSNDYVMAFPSDTQAIDPPFQGYGYGFRKVAEQQDAIVLMPEYRIDAPILGGSRRNGVATRSASVGIQAEMMLSTYVTLHTAKMKWATFMTKGPIMDLGENIGEIGDATDDSPRTANAISAGLARLTALGADMQTRSGTWGMKIEPSRYTAAVLRGGVSMNMEIERVARAEFARD